MEITIATWNIGGGKPIKSIESFKFKDSDYLDEDSGYFATILKELDPDIVCLQESHTGLNKSLSTEIGEQIGAYYCSEVGLSESHIDSRYKLTNSILTKVSPNNEEVHILPYPSFPLTMPDGSLPVKHEKGIQLVQFDFGNIVNLHLQPLRFLGTPYDTPKGLAYAQEVEKELEKHTSGPIIICGDFNYNDSASLYPNLIKKLCLKDALPNVSTRPDHKKTDYIFVSPEFNVIEAKVVTTNSDHFLCYARLNINI